MASYKDYMNEVKEEVSLGQDYLKKNDLSGFYELIKGEFAHRSFGPVTMFLEANGIYLEHYLNYIPQRACTADFIPRHWLSGNTLKIPSQIQTIGEQAFYLCDNFEYLILPNVSMIDYKSFEDCANLKKVRFEAEEPEIAENAFTGCLQLEVFDAANENIAKDLAFAAEHYLWAPKRSLDLSKLTITVNDQFYSEHMLLAY